jgi:hypothetical protein
MKKQKVADIIDSRFDGIKAESGFYVWWFPQEAANELIKPLKKFIDDDRLEKIQVEIFDGQPYYALYFGIASKKGGLLQRIKWHTAAINPHTAACVRSRTLSTLRQTICGLMGLPMVGTETQKKVDEIIKKCYWEWTEHHDPHEIELENLNSENLCYPFNIMGNNTISKDCRKELKRLRSKYRNI